MRLDGWIFMLLSWAVILSLFGYSMYRTLSGKPPGESSNTKEDA